MARATIAIARELSGRSSSDMVGLLAAQLACTARGARLVVAMTRGDISAQRAHRAMRELEHEGDRARAALVVSLGRVLSTPIDAEDIFRLSRSIDDVLDNLRDFVREVELYEPTRLEFARPLAACVAKGVESLAPALQQLARRPGEVGGAAFAARKAAGEVRRMFQRALAELLQAPLDNDTLKCRELLRRLDVVGLRLSEATDALADGALKRGR